MTDLSVAVYDEQFLTREGIASLLHGIPGYCPCMITGSFQSFESYLTKNNPDVVIASIHREVKQNTLEMIAKSSDPKHWLILAKEKNYPTINALVEAGIKCIVSKMCEKDEIINGLKAAGKGNRYYSNTILDLLLGSNEPDEPQIHDNNILTEREQEVFLLIVNGHSSMQIAEKLFVSVHTVNSHRKNILRKLNLKSPTELILYAVDHGMLNINQ